MGLISLFRSIGVSSPTYQQGPCVPTVNSDRYDEVYFRDTAHGFLAWAVATLVTATLIVGSVSSVVGGSVQAGQADAEARIDKVYGDARKAVEDAKLKAKQAADTAAKVAAYTSLWTFITLLMGAFMGCIAAFGCGGGHAALELSPVIQTAIPKCTKSNVQRFVSSMGSKKSSSHTFHS